MSQVSDSVQNMLHFRERKSQPMALPKQRDAQPPNFSFLSVFIITSVKCILQSFLIHQAV